MNAYEAAPATQLLATRCAICARALLDSVSVETGIGPECRKRHGYVEAQGEPDWAAVLRFTDGVASVAELFPGGSPEAAEAAWRLGGLETRRVANLFVHRIAALQTGDDAVALVQALAALGFTRLSARIGERFATVRIEEDGDEYIVRTPYSPEGAAAFRALPYLVRRFDRQANAWRVRKSARRSLFNTLRYAYAGERACGPKGLFTLGASR